MRVRNTEDNFQTRWEVISLLLPSVFLITISSLNATLITKHFNKSNKKLLIFFSDIFIIVVPMIAYYMPIYCSENYYLHFYIFSMIVGYGSYLLYIFLRPNGKELTFVPDEKKSVSNEVTSKSDRKSFITNMRSILSLLTGISILAVDFNTFPVECQKTHNYGYSLMDVGVGLFISANGIVAPEITNKTKESFHKTVTGSALLLILGILRFALTKILNYPFSEAEYGLHWNFFMTLAFTKICCSFILNYFPFKNKLLISVTLLTFYETTLNNGLGMWVLSESPRTNFISANREGIFSTIGYVSLYFATVLIGRLLYQTKPKQIIVSLLFVSIALYVMTCILDSYFNVSRRTANAGYCTWILFLATFLALLFFIMEMFLKYCYKLYKYKEEVYSPLIIDAINYNALPYFLLSNVLTGIINLCIDTTNIKNETSLLIVFVYMLINCYFVTFLYNKKIKLKLFS